MLLQHARSRATASESASAFLALRASGIPTCRTFTSGHLTEGRNLVTQPTSAALSSMRLAELQNMASSMGIKSVSKYRKADLVDVIRGQSGASATPAASNEAPTTRSSRGPRNGDGEAASRPEAAHRPEGSQRSEQTERSEQSERSDDDGSGSRRDRTGGGRQQERRDDGEDTRRQDQREDGGRGRQQQGRRDQDGQQAEGGDEPRGQGRGSRRAGAPTGAPQEQDSERVKQDLMRELENATQRRSENREQGGRGGQNQQRQGNQGGQGGQGGGQNQQRQGGQGGQGGYGGQGGQDRDEGSRRSRSRDRGRNRSRDRDRDRRQGPDHSEPEIREDDVVVPVAGILDVLENYAFVRTSGYLPGPNDVYVTLGQVKNYGLRRGDAVTGAVRQPHEDEQQRSSRQKFNALVRLDTVNGMTPEDARRRPDFQKLTPLYPTEMLRLETTPKAITPRVIDLFSPIGKGQRGLIVAPPKAGKTIVMQQLANAIAVNNPEAHLMVVLVDERPEEVTDMQRMVKGEVIASTFDRPASDHTIVAELAIERAKRLVEMGGDVVVLLDSLTRLSRAYNLAAPASGRILSGGVDAGALYPPKRFFGAARNIEGGGSLTIIASALVETGSKMDEVIFEEFKGTGNLELRLSRQLADKRIFPAVDINASGTRREELLLSSEELKIVWRLRRIMGGLEKEAAIELVLGKLRETQSNAEFLLAVSRTTPGGKDELAELAAGTGATSAE
nr:transcription termination factor Rho [Actinomycetales bacterium]